MRAARSNGAFFYPINPGHEEVSWEHFFSEVANRFRDGQYTSDYEKKLIEEFESFLPSMPPWKR
jgi:hypothetical protein